jgi:signal peptidase I
VLHQQTPHGDNESSLESIGLFIWDLVKVFIVAFILVWLIIRPFIAEPFIVSGSSMVPNFHNKEYLIVEKLSYRFSEPERGDIIVFRYPKDPSQYFIKRIIGLPGEKVRISQGHVYIYNEANPDGFELQEPFIDNQPITFGDAGTVAVGSDEYFVLGDNRLQSSDSRVWGILPREDFIGKVWIRVLPINKIGVIEHENLE